MINWEFLGQVYPIPDWQTLDHQVGDSEIFLFEIKYAKPGGLVLIRQEFDDPPYHLGLSKLRPDHDRYIINLPIPPEIKAFDNYTRKIAYKLAETSVLYEARLTLLIAKIQ